MYTIGARQVKQHFLIGQDKGGGQKGNNLKKVVKNKNSGRLKNCTLFFSEKVGWC